MQLLPGYWLLHDRRSAERETLVLIRHDRNDDDRNVRECRRLLDATEELPAVHVGQQDIQRDQRQRLQHREMQCRLGRRGVQDLEALCFKLHADKLRGLDVVFHHERSGRSLACRGPAGGR